MLARDTATGTDRVLEIKSSAVDVEDERVRKMVAESVDHAFDDVRERVWTEAQQKAIELLPAVEAALDQAGESIEPAERESIQSAMIEVRAALSAGEISRLESAVSALDRVTEHLAALLVERALEDSLRRKGVLSDSGGMSFELVLT